VASLFRRQSTSPAEPEVDESTPVLTETVIRKAYTPKKGEATPKRPVANPRLTEAKPTDRKAYAARSRQEQAEARRTSRERMMAGDEKYLLAKDRGPVRRLARDVVDSRFNMATILFFGLFATLFLAMGVFPPIVRTIANGLLIFMMLATLADTYLSVRKVRRLAAERVPKETNGLRGLFFYVLMRSISIRRLRIPKPQVRVGQEI
jgi:Protein of unknown function (DUF3043)